MDARHLGLLSFARLQCGIRFTGNARLSWRKVEGADHRGGIALYPRMNHPSQATPDDDASSGNDLRAGVHIAKHHHMSGIFNTGAGTERFIQK